MIKKRSIPSQKEFEQELSDNEECMGEHAAMTMTCQFFGISEQEGYELLVEGDVS